MLSKNERDRLHEIERQFADENPEFVRKFAKDNKRRRAHHVLGWTVFVLAMVLMTSAAGLGGAITVLVVTFIVIAATPAWRRHVSSNQQASRSDHDHRSYS